MRLTLIKIALEAAGVGMLSDGVLSAFGRRSWKMRDALIWTRRAAYATAILAIMLMAVL